MEEWTKHLVTCRYCNAIYHPEKRVLIRYNPHRTNDYHEDVVGVLSKEQCPICHKKQ